MNWVYHFKGLVLYLKMPNSFPNQVCRGIMRVTTATPARHVGPISYHRKTMITMACRGPTHR